MSSKKRTITRHKTATIAMVAVLAVSLAVYCISEKVLRTAMLKPIKREQVDFAKVLDWLPPKAKAELEYRARYLDLRQKYDEAETKADKLRTAYALAVHTRDMDEHNQLMLQFIDNPAYAGMKNLYLPYMRMLRDPKNPKAISIQKYYDFINSLTDPEEVFLAWKDGRDRLGKFGLRDIHIVHADFLMPLLDKPVDSFIIKDYTQLFDNLKRNTLRISNDAAKRLEQKRERPGDVELVGKMKKISQKAELYQNTINRSTRNYNLRDFRRLLELRAEYEKAATPEQKLDAAFKLVRHDRSPAERRAIADELRKNPDYLKNPKIANVFAQLTDDRDFVQKAFLPYIKSLNDPVLLFRTWQEVYRRLTAVPVSAEQKLEVFRPLLDYSIDQIHFREYDYIYDIVARCAVFVNDQPAYEKAVQMKSEMQKTKPPLKTYMDNQQKQEKR